MSIMLYSGTFIFKKCVLFWTFSKSINEQKVTFLSLTFVFSQNVLVPILKLPETVLTFCTSVMHNQNNHRFSTKKNHVQ